MHKHIPYKLSFSDFEAHSEGVIFSGTVMNTKKITKSKIISAAHTFKHPFAWMAIKWKSNGVPCYNWCICYGPLCLKIENLKELGVRLKNKELVQLLVDADDQTLKMYRDLCL